ncbi:hypothetical protein VFPPC_17491 [Pochonia chlamydosporia 170]|uniref:Uncharacterized protein n=1 Tax=Pochonia chlamydosporia 170 TaxID=1380566 RepID=A0A219ARF4_METCM|nr:hypothetical protein VFPPC_17491 [Pochonia chlamydosporia 170]OWT43346.1 hypothetical protein VFPPC_17491 [Pochonia chlamydosporia 170]
MFKGYRERQGATGTYKNIECRNISLTPFVKDFDIACIRLSLLLVSGLVVTKLLAEITYDFFTHIGVNAKGNCAERVNGPEHGNRIHVRFPNTHEPK